MNASDFRRIALSLEGAEEGSHMGQADFRVGGRIFATLAAEKQGYGNLMLTPEQQAAFIAEQPEAVKPAVMTASGPISLIQGDFCGFSPSGASRLPVRRPLGGLHWLLRGVRALHHFCPTLPEWGG
jgi:hypothetical protein